MVGIDNNTVLMLHGEDFTDNSYSPKTISNSGASIGGGKFDSGFVFDGLTNYIKVNNIDLQSTLSNDFTIDFFANITSRNKTYPTPLSIIGSTTSVENRSLWIYFKAGATEFYFGNGTSSSIKITAGALNLNQWYHIAITRKGNIFKVYIDGKLINSVTNDSFYSPNGLNFYLGALSSDNSNTPFGGKLDEIRVSNVARWESNFAPPAQKYVKLPIINVLSKTREFINFNIEGSNINKVDVLVNGVKKQSFTYGFNDLKFIIDLKDSSYVKGENIIKIEVTYANSFVCSEDILHNICITEQASLKEVMDEFEKMSYMNLSNIDIKVLSELPKQVKEGRIVILNNSNYGNIFLDVEENIDDLNIKNNDILIKCYSTSTVFCKKFNIYSNNISANLHVKEVFINKDGVMNELIAYIGVNGEWKRTKENMVILDKNVINESIGLTLKKNAPNASINSHVLEVRNNGIYHCLNFNYDNLGGYTITTNKAIDMTEYKTLSVSFTLSQKSLRYNNDTVWMMRIGIGSTLGSLTSFVKTSQDISIGSYTLELDVSNINQTQYININSTHPGTVVEQTITRIELK